MKAAFYAKDTGTPVRVMSSVTTRTFNTALKSGQTWRIVPEDTNITDVPPLESIEPHDDLEEVE